MEDSMVLLGGTVEPPELEEEEMPDFVDKASNSYNMIEITNKIGEDTFKETFQVFIEEIRTYPIQVQIDFAKDILGKISEVYDFVFPEEIKLENQENVDGVYELIKFIEYDNIEFLSYVWEKIDFDLRKGNLDEFCENNAMKIINIVEIESETQNFNDLISIFLRTYYRKGIIDFVKKMTEKSKMEILLNILERKENA